MLLSAMALFLFVPLSATWAVWEGNAGIAASSEFPGSGMFARSDMFPKNTIVEIQNLETDVTVRAIITGSAGMPGLVAVLSPETASALNIASGAVCRVRISIPSPVAERSAEGTSVSPTGTETTDPDVNPDVAAKTAKPVNLESFGEDSSDQLVPLNSAPVAEVPPAEVPAAETPVAATPVAEVPPEEAPEVVVAETAPEATTEATPEPTTEPIPEVTAEVAPEATTEVAVAEPTPEVTAETAPAIPEESAAPTIAAEPETPEEPVTVTAGESVPVADEKNAGVSYEEPEVTMVPEVTIIPDPETAEVADTSEAPAEPAIDVTLVPAEANPPEPVAAEPEAPAVADVPVAEPIAPIAKTPEPTVVAEPVVPVAEPVAEPVVVVTVEPVVEAPAAEPVAAPAIVAPVAVAPVELPSTGPAKKGQIYIQIASYADGANVKKVIDAYGKKYPYVLEKTVAKKGEVTKILIGPIGKDEYGAVLERFKKFGFKDAFVKKVN